MKSLTVSAPAKVNLFLQVLGRRRDGFHELLTVFHRISLKDRLTLKKIQGPEFRLRTTHPKLKRISENLIYKAYRELHRVRGWKGGVEVFLKKNIPISAGLGGGSSDAAHFLLAMNRLFNLHLSSQTLSRIGAKLGSDIPFFIDQINQAIGTGRGEKIKQLPMKGRLWFVLVVPHFWISTALVYKKLKEAALTRISRDATITSAFSGDWKKGNFGHFLRNDLFLTSSRLKPELKRFDMLFEQVGARQRLMSGSGPSMFSIHKSKREARRIARLLRYRKPSADVFVCHTY